HTAQLFRHFFHARGRHDFHLWQGLGDLDLDLHVVELAFTQTLAESLTGAVLLTLGLAHRVAGGRHQYVENAVFGGIFCQRAHAAHGRFARQLHGGVDEVANDGLHVSTDITDFGELGGLDL